MVTRHRLIYVLVIVALGGATAWLTARWVNSSSRRPNVVLISIDTCRADHLSCYGRFRRTTPRIDAVAAESVLFENVIAPVPMTLPSHSSMLTGTIPPYHGVHGNLDYRLADDNVTIAERLREHGYRTGAVIGSFVLDDQFGTAQGFDDYDDDCSESSLEIMGGHPERRGDEVTRSAITWLEEHASEPFFLFVHYYDPHLPYRAPEPFGSIFADDPYMGEVAYTDECVGQLIDKLKELGLYESALLVITADHGESRGEHGELQHGYFIYHATTKVPLIVKRPGPSAPRRVSDKVALIDIVPTIVAQVGLPAPEDVQGADLSAHLAGAADAGKKRLIYAESMVATKYGCASLLGLENEDWKYIQTTEPELYDLGADPAEEHNLATEQPERAQGFQDGLRELLKQHLRTHVEGSRVAADSETTKKLESLGYVGDIVETFDFDFDNEKEDPKQFLEVFNMIEGVHYTLNRHEPDKARRLAETILEKRADVPYVHEKLGKIAFEEGKLDEAVMYMTQAIRLNPNVAEWHHDLAIWLSRLERLDEAVDHYRECIRLADSDAAHQDNLDRLLANSRLGRPIIFSACVNLGRALYRQGKVAEAAQQFQRAVETDPDRAEARFLLGESLRQLGRTDEAVEAFRRTLTLDPGHESARRALDALQPPETPTTTP